MKTMINIVIIEDCTIILNGIIKLVSCHNSIKIIACHSSLPIFLQQINDLKEFPDVVILSNTADHISEQHIEINASIKILYLVKKINVFLLTKILQSKANGIIKLNCSEVELQKAIFSVYKNEYYCGEEVLIPFRH